MFGKNKKLLAENDELRARISALENALNNASADETQAETEPENASYYWDANGGRWYTTPGGVEWRIAQKILDGVHCLIAGTTGCGKSTLINDIIYTALNRLPANCTLFLCDPKKVELSRFQYCPHTSEYADTHADILQVVRHVERIMDNRFSEMKRDRVRKYDGGHIYLIIDEIADLRIGECSKEFTRVLQRILQLGRAAGISVIAATQAPNRQIIPASLVINFPQRVGLRCASGIESRQIVGVNGCEQLPAHGVGIFVDGADISREIIPLTEDADLDARIDHWRDQDIAAYKCRTRAARRNMINETSTFERARYFLGE